MARTGRPRCEKSAARGGRRALISQQQSLWSRQRSLTLPLSLTRFNQVLNTSIVAHLESIPSTSRERYPEIEKEREEERGREADAFLASRLLPRSSRSFLFPHLLPLSTRRVKRLRVFRVIATVDGVETVGTGSDTRGPLRRAQYDRWARTDPAR